MVVLVAWCGACDAGEREVTHLATQFHSDPVFVLAACRHPAVHPTVDVQRQTERITTVTPGHERECTWTHEGIVGKQMVDK